MLGLWLGTAFRSGPADRVTCSPATGRRESDPSGSRSRPADRVTCGSSKTGKVFPFICTPGIPTVRSWCGGRRWRPWGCL